MRIAPALLRLACVVAASGAARVVAAGPAPTTTADRPYVVVDTGQRHVFDTTRALTTAPAAGSPLAGQDGGYDGPQPSYRDLGDGTVLDVVTGLVWQKAPELDRLPTFPEALAGAKTLRLAGHDDWRLPTIKELYSLMLFEGDSRARTPRPYLDARVFGFRFGDPARGERTIDAQYWSSTEYLGTTMRGAATVFGVNFADGRIKGYPRDVGPDGRPARHFARYVRGNPAYGRNDFHDEGDGTVVDRATGLVWSKADSGKPLDWTGALAWAEGLVLAGHDDWRLPHAKELQSLVDYGRAPDATDPARHGPAIDPVFTVTDPDAWGWSSTTHLEGPGGPGSAVYLAFGRATGLMPGPRGLRRVDAHGAGAQRSDPKQGDPTSARWASGMGPQGDEIRILLYARAVRDLVPGTTKRAKPDLSPLPPSRHGGPEGGPPPGPPQGPPPGGR